MKSNTEQGPVRYVIDERLDLNHFGPLRKSYIVASSYRSGSQYLCWRLWQTGLLGAPSEVLNPTSELRVLMSRFNASSPADYIAKLLARRTSRNGVFGMKAHFHHFEAFQKEYPPLLEVLAPTTYIYISRQDRIAQAVSMAKALQTDAWTSRMEEGPKPVLFYDREMIAHCLVDIEQQDATWRRWFETYKITPFQVTYDELTADAARVVRNFVEFLGVQNDERDEVDIPPAKKQADETNQEWIERFEREAKAEGQRRRVGADIGEGSARASGPEPEVSADAHFFDRFNRVVKSIPTGAASATGFLDLIRSRRRYDAIVARNRKLYQNARVLDVMSAYGLWSLAALDAGAVHVVGVEASPPMVEAAANTFRECGVAPHSYRFINSDVLEAIQAFEPESFDLILCQAFFEQCNILQFFRQLHRLRPKQVILDTGIVIGEGPIARFRLEIGDILAAPDHALVMSLCDTFDFRWRLTDWRAAGIVDWTGIHDYERDQRRTYILDRIS